MRWLLSFLLALHFASALSLQSLPAQNRSTQIQRFELVDPSGVVSGNVEAVRGRLLVYERTGARVYYSRDVRFDSLDRSFVGYFNHTLNRVLRFPRSGSGVLQTADLDDRVPRFENTIQIVRPIGAAGGGTNARPWDGGYGRIAGGIATAPYVDPYATGFRGVGPPAQSVLIDSQTVPNEALPPARVSFRNDGPRELQIAVVDLTNPSAMRSMRIRPGAAAEVDLARDAGVTRVSHYRVITPYGESITQEFVTNVPPSIRYEVVVHEWAIQSVAIDRTGKSANPIEDINFQGRGLGRFPLPPGPELQSGTIEVYRAARSRGNAGSVAPIVPAEDAPHSSSPLERAILEAQRAAQRK